MLTETFQAKIQEWARFRPRQMALFSGIAFQFEGGVLGIVALPPYIPPILETLRSLPGVILEDRGFAITEDGTYHHPSAQEELKHLLIATPELDTGHFERVPAGLAALNLFNYATSRVMDPELALSAAGAVATRVPVYRFDASSFLDCIRDCLHLR